MFAIYKISDPRNLIDCSNNPLTARKNILRDTEGGRPRLPVGFGNYAEAVRRAESQVTISQFRG